MQTITQSLTHSCKHKPGFHKGALPGGIKVGDAPTGDLRLVLLSTGFGKAKTSSAVSAMAL
jgi:hypothetical protein